MRLNLTSEFPRWAEWVAAVATAAVASGAVYGVCVLFVFDYMWIYPLLPDLRRGHPEAITGALTAATWVACESLAAPTPRAWVPFVTLCAAVAPIVWILGVTGPYSDWGPPVAEFIAGTSSAGFPTAVALTVLLAFKARSQRSWQAPSWVRTRPPE